MAKVQRDNELIQLDGGPFGALSFEWQQDRYRHAWTFLDSDVSIQSLESASDDVWPLSAPLQQIHSQSFGDGREVIFGVGMAGRGHWSASFTLVPDLKCWIVELACRSNVEPERLLSSYEVLRSGSPAPLEICDQTIAVDPERGICLEAIAPGTLGEVDAAAGIDVACRLRFLPAQISSSSITTQWAFRLRVP
ncbi:MAG: hypothetical protein NXI32_10865 [bacterium]|nr:hypothetical protein [bacterium]